MEGQEEIRMSAEEETLKVLKENQELLKKQVRQGRLKNLMIAVVTVVFCICAVFMMNRLDQAMETVNSIQKLTDEIAGEIEDLNMEDLNSTLENLSSITEEMKEATDSLASFSEGMSSLFRY